MAESSFFVVFVALLLATAGVSRFTSIDSACVHNGAITGTHILSKGLTKFTMLEFRHPIRVAWMEFPCVHYDIVPRFANCTTLPANNGTLRLHAFVANTSAPDEIYNHHATGIFDGSVYDVTTFTRGPSFMGMSIYFDTPLVCPLALTYRGMAVGRRLSDDLPIVPLAEEDIPSLVDHSPKFVEANKKLTLNFVRSPHSVNPPAHNWTMDRVFLVPKGKYCFKSESHERIELTVGYDSPGDHRKFSAIGQVPTGGRKRICGWVPEISPPADGQPPSDSNLPTARSFTASDLYEFGSVLVFGGSPRYFFQRTPGSATNHSPTDGGDVTRKDIDFIGEELNPSKDSMRLVRIISVHGTPINCKDDAGRRPFHSRTRSVAPRAGSVRGTSTQVAATFDLPYYGVYRVCYLRASEGAPNWREVPNLDSIVAEVREDVTNGLDPGTHYPKMSGEPTMGPSETLAPLGWLTDTPAGAPAPTWLPTAAPGSGAPCRHMFDVPAWYNYPEGLGFLRVVLQQQHLPHDFATVVAKLLCIEPSMVQVIIFNADRGALLALDLPGGADADDDRRRARAESLQQVWISRDREDGSSRRFDTGNEETGIVGDARLVGPPAAAVSLAASYRTAGLHRRGVGRDRRSMDSRAVLGNHQDDAPSTHDEALRYLSFACTSEPHVFAALNASFTVLGAHYDAPEDIIVAPGREATPSREHRGGASVLVPVIAAVMVVAGVVVAVALLVVYRRRAANRRSGDGGDDGQPMPVVATVVNVQPVTNSPSAEGPSEWFGRNAAPGVPVQGFGYTKQPAELPPPDADSDPLPSVVATTATATVKWGAKTDSAVTREKVKATVSAVVAADTEDRDVEAGNRVVLSVNPPPKSRDGSPTRAAKSTPPPAGTDVDVDEMNVEPPAEGPPATALRAAAGLLERSATEAIDNGTHPFGDYDA